MKTKSITAQKARYLLRNRLEVKNLTDSMTMQEIKQELYNQGGGALLCSGAKIYFNLDLKGKLEGQTPLGPVYHTGWFISGYAADGKDVDCFFDAKVMKEMIKYRRVIHVPINIEPIINKLERKLKAFIKTTSARNLWLHLDEVEVYVRKSYRNFGFKGELKANCLDVASINVGTPYQNLGIFKAFMDLVVKHSKLPYILLENVNNDYLHHWAIKNAWILNESENSYYTERKLEVSNA